MSKKSVAGRLREIMNEEEERRTAAVVEWYEKNKRAIYGKAEELAKSGRHSMIIALNIAHCLNDAERLMYLFTTDGFVVDRISVSSSSDWEPRSASYIKLRLTWK